MACLCFSCHVQLISLSHCNVGDIMLLAIACWAIDGFSSSAMTAMLQPIGHGCCTVRNWMSSPEWALTLAVCDCAALLWQCGNWGFCKRHILGLLKSCRSWNHSAQISVWVTVFFFLNTFPGPWIRFCIRCWYVVLMSWQFNCVHILFRATAMNLCCLVFE